MPVIDKISLRGTTYDINDTGARANKVDNSVIAPVETESTASRAYSNGDYFIKSGAFCTVINDISIGDTLTENTNYTTGQLVDSLTPSTILTGTLTAGNTTLTLTNAAITTNSLIDVYTTVFGLSPTNISVSTGTMTLTFAVQQSDVGVKVILM